MTDGVKGLPKEVQYDLCQRTRLVAFGTNTDTAVMHTVRHADGRVIELGTEVFDSDVSLPGDALCPITIKAGNVYIGLAELDSLLEMVNDMRRAVPDGQHRTNAR
jgi:hypothetical protein